MNSSSVLIAGAGPSGLILALSLLQNGIPVLIIDKEPKPRVGQRGAGIQSRSIELYNFLGVLPEIRKRALPSPTMRLYKTPGGTEPLKTWPMAPYLDSTPGFPYLNAIMLGQNNVEAVLRAALKKYTECRIEYSTELRTFEQYDDHVMAHVVRVRDGEEIKEDIKCSWLVGTDGAHSVVRKQLGCTFLGETRESQHMVNGDIYITGLDNECWSVWGEASKSIVGLRPTEDDNVFMFYIFAPDYDPIKLVNSRDELLKCIYATTERTDLVFGEISWITDYRPNIRMVDKFGEGRVFIAGDAAHVHSPTGGQGLNSSIQDSFNLGWKLALVEKGLANQSLLSSYSEERLPVISDMLGLTTKLLNKTFTAKGDDVSGWTRGGKLLQLGVNYRTSPIVIDEHLTSEVEELKELYAKDVVVDTRLAAGDRAPDAPGLVGSEGEPKSLFGSVFGVTYHTVLIFCKAAEEGESVLDGLRLYPDGVVQSAIILPRLAVDQGLSQHSSAAVLEDRENHAFRIYGVSPQGTTIVIVRPDGVIGAIVGGEDGLKRYFSYIFKE